MTSLKSCSILQLLLVLAVAQGKVVQYTFDVSYISGAPDGVHLNSILGINGKFPGPVVEAMAGDILEIDVINNIQDGQNVTMHWHGILQRGTPFEDGPSQVTQCPIKQGSHQLYRFEVPIPGTYWYHSHVNSQYTEGLWGVMIIRNQEEVYGDLYDGEILITLNDWYHTSGFINEEWLLSPASEGAPPYPSSALMNGIGRYPCDYATLLGNQCSTNAQKRPVFRVQRGKTYRVRVVNTAGWTAFNFTIDGHKLRTIEVDGLDTVASEAANGDAVYISAGQRYSFLVSTSLTAPLFGKFLIRANMRKEFLFTRPNSNINKYPEATIGEVTGVLQYALFSPTDENNRVKATKEKFDHTETHETIDWSSLRFVTENVMVPYDRIPAPLDYDQELVLNIAFKVDADGIRRGSFNGKPFGGLEGRPQIARYIRGKDFPEESYPVEIKYGDVIQVVVNNPEAGPHPIHLHGHHFWVMGGGLEGDGNYDPERHELNFNGVRRDTTLVKDHSWLVIRFQADNPGVWSLHCHVDWHMLTGMMMTFIEAPEYASSLVVPDEARRVCADHGIEF